MKVNGDHSCLATVHVLHLWSLTALGHHPLSLYGIELKLLNTLKVSAGLEKGKMGK